MRNTLAHESLAAPCPIKGGGGQLLDLKSDEVSLLLMPVSNIKTAVLFLLIQFIIDTEIDCTATLTH